MKKKITPVFSVIILIFLVICAGILSIFIKKYTPSGTIIDGKDYFQLTGVRCGEERRWLYTEIINENKNVKQQRNNNIL